MSHTLIPVERIRLSQQARDQLITLKRRTGLRQWNELCRWAFCRSLAEKSVPTLMDIPADSSIEMTWKVFGGEEADLYAAALFERCIQDGSGTEEPVLAQQFRLHLHRGISYLVADQKITTSGDLLKSISRG